MDWEFRYWDFKISRKWIVATNVYAVLYRAFKEIKQGLLIDTMINSHALPWQAWEIHSIRIFGIWIITFGYHHKKERKIKLLSLLWPYWKTTPSSHSPSIRRRMMESAWFIKVNFFIIANNHGNFMAVGEVFPKNGASFFGCLSLYPVSTSIHYHYTW